jgi:hypothetical protein
MLRISTLLLAGAFLAGCQESDMRAITAHHGGVQGDKSYGNNVEGEPTFAGHKVYGTENHVTGEPSYRPSEEMPARTASVRTETTVSAPDAARTANKATDAAPGEVTNRTGTKADPERAAFANTAHFPADMKASDELRATAIIDGSSNTIKIANPNAQEIRDAKIWIDGRYVVQVNSIPARGTVIINRADLSDRNGNLPADLRNVGQVQLQTRDNLYNLQGPVYENR